MGDFGGTGRQPVSGSPRQHDSQYRAAYYSE